jgi:hypothetical protein
MVRLKFRHLLHLQPPRVLLYSVGTRGKEKPTVDGGVGTGLAWVSRKEYENNEHRNHHPQKAIRLSKSALIRNFSGAHGYQGGVQAKYRLSCSRATSSSLTIPVTISSRPR